jgi:hypothetical protein
LAKLPLQANNAALREQDALFDEFILPFLGIILTKDLFLMHEKQFLEIFHIFLWQLNVKR